MTKKTQYTDFEKQTLIKLYEGAEVEAFLDDCCEGRYFTAYTLDDFCEPEEVQAFIKGNSDRILTKDGKPYHEKNKGRI